MDHVCIACGVTFSRPAARNNAKPRYCSKCRRFKNLNANHERYMRFRKSKRGLPYAGKYGKCKTQLEMLLEMLGERNIRYIQSYGNDLQNTETFYRSKECSDIISIIRMLREGKQ